MLNTEQQYTLALRTALIAGLFAAVVGLLLLIDFQGRVDMDPLNSPEYVALKTQLAKERQNADLKTRVREADLVLREKYFRQRRFAEAGTWLLLSGAVLALACAKWAAMLRRRLPAPAPRDMSVDSELLSNRIARWSVGALAALAVVTIVSLGVSLPQVTPRTAQEIAALVDTKPASGERQLPDSPPEPQPNDQPGVKQEPPQPGPDTNSPPAAGPALPSGFPTDEELRRNWASFRGPGGLGISAFTNMPIKWDAESGENVLWKTEVPLPGNSSAIVWEKRVFLTGATKDQRQVFCFDTETGKLLWQKDVPGTPEGTAKEVKLNAQTGFAASTAATDGRRVYAIFANGDLAAFDFEGQLRWSHSFGVLSNSYGHAASLAMVQNLVIVQLDQGTKAEKLSRLIGLKADSGEIAWETPREVPNSWPSPIVVQHEGQVQIITAASPWVSAYSPADGKELWRADRLRGDVGPSPVAGNGMIYVANEFPAASAIRLGGSGDVTKTHTAFVVESGLPDTVSPLVTDKYLLLVASYGTVSCYDALTGGDPLWEKDFEDANFTSSPGLVGNHVYLFEQKGKVFIVEPTDKEGKIVSESNLGEECVTCPAFQDGRLYIRGNKHLFCIGQK
ncbi:MAG: PQQ-binding-like beta-propeller repeat protein [Planctomycetota bacterium]|nr:PQQ-binding-like beta-propeller repeat protein [Planctomycetota bacterium]